MFPQNLFWPNLTNLRVLFCILSLFLCAYKEVPKQNYLFAACSRGKIDTVKQFVEKEKIDINLKDDLGQNSIFYAVSSKKTDIATYLLKKGVTVNTISKEGLSPLSIGIVQNNYSMVELLLKNGADSNMVIQEKFSPLTYAESLGRDKIVSLLLKYGAKKKGERPPRLDFNNTVALEEYITKQKINQEKLIRKNALKNLDVYISKEGLIKLDKDNIELKQLPGFLKKNMILDSGTSVNIRCKDEVNAKTLRAVLRIFWKEGVFKTSIATESALRK